MGTGTVDLQATGNAGSILNWYDVSTGGSILGMGTTFTTPNISASTNYYVEPNIYGAVASGGRLTNTAGSALGGVPRGVIFTASSALTIDSIGFLCTGIATTVTVQLYNSGGTATVGAPVNIVIPANSGTSTVPVLVVSPGRYFSAKCRNL